MANRRTDGFKGFFEDKEGHVVIWQWPNVPLWGWIVFEILGFMFSKGRLQHGISLLSTAFLFTWAYLELTDGVSYFRRLLGLAVITLIIFGFFK